MAKILIIDDDGQLRQILQQLLTSSGHAVTTAHDGADGLRRFRAEPADLIITDVFMPDQDGLGTILALRREFPGVRIIAISGRESRSPNWLTVAARLGATRTLANPFTVGQLTEAIADVLAARADPVGQA